MTVTLVWLARVDEDGRIKPDRRHDFLRHVKGFTGQQVEVIVRKPRKQRSDRQNRYYWGVMLAILSEHLGYEEPEELHEALKLHFLRVEDPEKPLPGLRSTASLSTREFEEYVEKVRMFASIEYGCYIPEPNEVEAA